MFAIILKRSKHCENENGMYLAWNNLLFFMLDKGQMAENLLNTK
jgi:hypothetical protein